MPKRKDLLLIVLVIVIAAVMLGVSRLMPGTDLSTKTADVTLAPDAIEYVEATPSPEATGMSMLIVPAETATPETDKAPEATEVPTVEPTVVPTQEPTAEPTAEPTTDSTAEPAQEAAMVGPMPPKKAETVRGYVVLTVGGRQYGDPIPMDRDKIITLKQDDGKLNKVHITPETVYMEFSTCENQDCVGQGEVHVDTYKDRILGTYIICLPNNVSIEMVPAAN